MYFTYMLCKHTKYDGTVVDNSTTYWPTIVGYIMTIYIFKEWEVGIWYPQC